MNFFYLIHLIKIKIIYHYIRTICYSSYYLELKGNLKKYYNIIFIIKVTFPVNMGFKKKFIFQNYSYF